VGLISPCTATHSGLLCSTLRIAVELDITSQAADFFNQILSFLAYGGSSILKTPNQTSFHMCRMVRVEVELSASVGGFPVDFGGQCLPFPDDPISETSCFLFSRIPDDGKSPKPSNSECVSFVIHLLETFSFLNVCLCYHYS
jgi:hypothetical protein